MCVTADVFRKPFATVMLALVAPTWVAFSIWSLSPYARYLNHEVLDHVPFTVTLDYFLLLTIFVAGWMLMTIAMMLPTSLPLVLLFRRMTRHRPDGLRLLFTLIGSYLAIWTRLGAWPTSSAICSCRKRFTATAGSPPTSGSSAQPSCYSGGSTNSSP